LGNEAAALADLNEILAAIEKMHSTLAASDFLKQNFRRLWEEAYSIAIDLHFRRGEFRQALEAAELARSRAFIDLLASRELERSTGVSGDKPSGLSSSPSIGLSSKVSAAPTTVEGLTAIAARLRSTVLAYWVSANTVFVWALTCPARSSSSWSNRPSRLRVAARRDPRIASSRPGATSRSSCRRGNRKPGERSTTC
jgi:hypothetical protein